MESEGSEQKQFFPMMRKITSKNHMQSSFKVYRRYHIVGGSEVLASKSNYRDLTRKRAAEYQ